ncbi:hypothetical protein TSAR_007747 [Trichomalopsis sarcophagae]|uniref:Uncharacterized protein n=1 Tax=Trichomalopsis sarcophagae TaxID=543379 RepID=A0A232FFI2_9HYME|nr:hypothetical protein TSAR_007747 [Trichomalopsis sarcophagae]
MASSSTLGCGIAAAGVCPSAASSEIPSSAVVVGRRVNLEFPPPPPYPPPQNGLQASQQQHLEQLEQQRYHRSLMHHHRTALHDAYSYAYYEPGSSQTSPQSCSSTLLRQHQEYHAAQPSYQGYRMQEPHKRHTYVTRYGTEENIYEEISEIGQQLLLAPDEMGATACGGDLDSGFSGSSSASYRSGLGSLRRCAAIGRTSTPEILMSNGHPHHLLNCGAPQSHQRSSKTKAAMIWKKGWKGWKKLQQGLASGTQPGNSSSSQKTDVSPPERLQSRDFARAALVEVHGSVVLVLVVVHRDAEKLLRVQFLFLVLLLVVGWLTGRFGRRSRSAAEDLVYSSVERPGYVVRLVLVPVNGILQLLARGEIDAFLKS